MKNYHYIPGLDRLSDAQLKRYFCICSRTIRNWRKYGVPEHAVYLLHLLIGTNSDYPGLRLHDGKFVTDNGYVIYSNEVAQLPWLREQIHHSLALQRNYREKFEAISKLSKSSNASAEFSRGLDDILKKFG